MNKVAVRKVIIGGIIFVSVLVFAQLLYHAHRYLDKRANHDKVIKYVNEDLAFRWDSMDSDLEYVNNWINSGSFYNEDIGRLYERASLIYLQKGETMSYYRYLGYALYYLEGSNERDYTINVYLDLTNFFLNNYAQDSAKDMIDVAQSVEDFDDIQSLQIRSYAFRMLGIMAILNGEYEDAEKYLLKSQDIVNISDTGIYEESYRAINDVWLARVYYETGRFDECKENLDRWEGHGIFTTDVYREIFLRDLIIPYYQVKCMLETCLVFEDKDSLSAKELEEKEMEVAEGLEEFMTLCDENGYKKTELATLLQLQSEYPPSSEYVRNLLYTKLQELYDELFDDQNSTYASLIDSTVLDAKTVMEDKVLYEKRVARRRRYTVIFSAVMVLIITAFVVIISNSRVDGLTKLLNRKSFNHELNRIKRRKNLYGIIMIDIDDFKIINDTYGHQNGDIVLERIGQLIQTERTADVHCFRYGGEELVLLLDKKAVPYADAVAERIRYAMEHQTWEFGENLVITISIGIATGSGSTDVLKQADENLYISKANGKNRITS